MQGGVCHQFFNVRGGAWASLTISDDGKVEQLFFEELAGEAGEVLTLANQIAVLPWSIIIKNTLSPREMIELGIEGRPCDKLTTNSL